MYLSTPILWQASCGATRRPDLVCRECPRTALSLSPSGTDKRDRPTSSKHQTNRFIGMPSAPTPSHRQSVRPVLSLTLRTGRALTFPDGFTDPTMFLDASWI